MGRRQERPIVLLLGDVMATPRAAIAVQPTLLARLEEARSRTDSLFNLLPPNSFYDRPVPERHRLIFYLGHLEAFDQNLLSGPLGLKSPDTTLDKLFAFGIDPVGGGLPTDVPSDWPNIGVVEAYKRGVRERLDAKLQDRSGLSSQEPALVDGTLLQVAIEHRLMHAETLAYLLHNLPVDRKTPQPSPYADLSVSRSEDKRQFLPATPHWDEPLLSFFLSLPGPRRCCAPSLRPPPGRRRRRPAPLRAPRGGGAAVSGGLLGGQAAIPAGDATLQTRMGARSFGWDNEFEEQQFFVPGFSIDVFPVTNGEYLKFVQAGGYEDPQHWTKEDWDWKIQQRLNHPFFWAPQLNSRSSDVAMQWNYRAMFGTMPLPSAIFSSPTAPPPSATYSHSALFPLAFHCSHSLFALFRCFFLSLLSRSSPPSFSFLSPTLLLFPIPFSLLSRSEC